MFPQSLTTKDTGFEQKAVGRVRRRWSCIRVDKPSSGRTLLLAIDQLPCVVSLLVEDVTQRLPEDLQQLIDVGGSRYAHAEISKSADVHSLVERVPSLFVA